MAGLPWIQLYTDLPRHPKAIALGVATGNQRAWTYMVQLWCWCAEHAQSGRVTGRHAETTVEIASGWDGNAGELVAAAVDAGFIDRIEGGLEVHGWAERAAPHIAKRERDAARNRPTQRRCVDESLTTPQRDVDESLTQNRFGVDESRSERERERERDIKETIATDDSANRPPPEPDTQFTAWIRANYPDVKEPHGFEAAQKAANPGIDLLSEAKKALAWERANPSKAKRNHGRFLNGWFARAQDSRGGRNRATADPVPIFDDHAWDEAREARLRAAKDAEWEAKKAAGVANV